MNNLPEELIEKILFLTIDYKNIITSIVPLICLIQKKWKNYNNKVVNLLENYIYFWNIFIKLWNINNLSIPLIHFCNNFIILVRTKCIMKCLKKTLLYNRLNPNNIIIYPYHKILKNMTKMYIETCTINDLFIGYTENCELWSGFLIGPPNTPYSGGLFEIDIKYKPDNTNFITIDYIKFKNKIYHPNIDENGYFSFDFEFQDWSPIMLRINKLLLYILVLLGNPLPDCLTTNPYNVNICKEYINNYYLFNKKAREYTMKYAIFDKDYFNEKFLNENNSFEI